jgi:choline dehydrogenase-like flavoprotein
MKVDLRFSEQDGQSVVAAHEILRSSLAASKTGQMEYLVPAEERLGLVLEQACDGYHQIGTTRMGADPKKSVVDKNCQVHGIKNLYVASSSVFPTSSQANPTLLITCLSLRLAHFLERKRAFAPGAQHAVIGSEA